MNKIDEIVQKSRLELSTVRPQAKPKTVRTTVALSEKAKRALVGLREDWNFAPKDIFDGIFEAERLLDLVRRAAMEMEPRKQPRQNQTSIVISAISQKSLRNLVNELERPRDHIVGVCFQVMVAVLEWDRTKRLANHKKALKHLDETKEFLAIKEEELRILLGEDDPLENLYSDLGLKLESIESAVLDEMNSRKPIDWSIY